MGSIEALRGRGVAVKLALDSTPIDKLPTPCRARLLKLVRGELNFLDRLPCESHSLLSSNFGHFEAIAQVLQHPLVAGICAVNQKFSVDSSPGAPAAAHVDLVGLFDGKPAWFVVSDRNPKHLLWNETGLQSRASLLLQAAIANPVARPSFVIFYFARGVEKAVEKSFEAEFKAYRIETDKLAEGDWLIIDDEEGEEPVSNDWVALPNNERRKAAMYRIDVAPTNLFEAEVISLNAHARGGDLPSRIEVPKGVSCGLIDSVFYSILEDVSWRWSGEIVIDTGANQETKLVNLDTTALIGMVSGLSNNMASSIAAWSSKKLLAKFLSFGHFFRAQALLELQKPFLPEVATIFKQKQPVVSEFAWTEFESIVSVVGGPDEKRRASALHTTMKHFIVPNNPSDRVSALPETGKIQEKHKIVFGTGDKLQAPTLTSNVSFVRAATSKGMALAFIEHRPLALTRD